jgi:hypothetical protein
LRHFSPLFRSRNSLLTIASNMSIVRAAPLGDSPRKFHARQSRSERLRLWAVSVDSLERDHLASIKRIRLRGVRRRAGGAALTPHSLPNVISNRLSCPLALPRRVRDHEIGKASPHVAVPAAGGREPYQCHDATMPRATCSSAS